MATNGVVANATTVTMSDQAGRILDSKTYNEPMEELFRRLDVFNVRIEDLRYNRVSNALADPCWMRRAARGTEE